MSVGTTKQKFPKGLQSNQMALLLELQGRSITPRTFKLREKPKNHMRDNRVKLRQLMAKVKEKEAQKNLPVKALWKSDQYKEINSKLKELMDVGVCVTLK
jgi:hypothetical protein